MLKLECTYCHGCFTIEEWNKANKGATALGLIEEKIPETLQSDEEWKDYVRKHGGRMDCPDTEECGEVSNFEDMQAY